MTVISIHYWLQTSATYFNNPKSKRIEHWNLRVQGYDFDVAHIAGTQVLMKRDSTRGIIMSTSSLPMQYLKPICQLFVSYSNFTCDCWYRMQTTGIASISHSLWNLVNMQVLSFFLLVTIVTTVTAQSGIYDCGSEQGYTLQLCTECSDGQLRLPELSDTLLEYWNIERLEGTWRGQLDGIFGHIILVSAWDVF